MDGILLSADGWHLTRYNEISVPEVSVAFHRWFTDDRKWDERPVVLSSR